MTDKTQVCEQDPSATVYHDGECPICNVEINAMKRLDKAKRIKWVDISKDQAALDAAGLSYQATMDRIHVKTADDSMITGVSGFMIVWAELPYFRRLVPIIRYVPGLQRLMEWAYVLFAKYRLKLTGKAMQSTMNDDTNASQIAAPTEQGVKIMSNKRYLITGGSGFIGSHLIPQLLAADNHVTVLTRTPAKTLAQFNHKISVVDKLDTLDNAAQFDVIINLAGQGIADKRWTDLVKQQLFDSRLLTTRALVEFMSRVDHKPELFISGSATGIYGLRDDQILTEDAQGDSSFSTKLCTDWEAEANAAEALGIRCCYLRTGIVLGKGGALSKMLPPFKFGLGGPMGNGQQWMSWIHINDLTGIIHHTVAHSDLSGPINGTAPNPVTNKVFASTLGNVLKRPAFLPLPSFVLKLLMGQMGEELLLSGHRAIPDKITRSGYSFIYESLEPALASIINNKSSPK
ncbi:MAG: TIGR01777 family oxidoreductase [Leucothrix sp.]